MRPFKQHRLLLHVIHAYVTVNALLLDAGHSGPEEGSEYYFGYAIEAATGAPSCTASSPDSGPS